MNGPKAKPLLLGANQLYPHQLCDLRLYFAETQFPHLYNGAIMVPTFQGFQEDGQSQ